MSQVSDELLVAYLDGQLDSPQAGSVERMASASEELRERLERLKRSQAYLIQTFETLARRTRASGKPAEAARGHAADAGQTSRTASRRAGDGLDAQPDVYAPSAPDQTSGGHRGSMGRKLAWAAMLTAMAAVLGYGAAQWLRASDTSGPDKISARVPAPAGRWAADVAQLHAHFTAASVSADPDSQTNPDLVQLQLSRITNASIPVPDFAEHDLAFQRGQVLSYRGSRMMQLSYTDADGQLIALYIMQGGPGARASAGVRGDVTTVHWSRDDLRYMIAGEMPETSLRALAAVAMAQIADR